MDIRKANEILESTVGRMTSGIGEAKISGPYANIAKLTDQNQHGEAILAGAKLFGFKRLEDRIKLVMQLQKIEGHMPSGLGDYQYGLYQELMDVAKQKLSPEAYEQFNMAY